MRFLVTWLLVSGAVASASFGAGSGERERLVERWRDVFECDVNFNEGSPLLNAVSWVGPWPREEMRRFEGVTRNRVGVRLSQGWINRFLKVEVRPDFDDVTPSHYLLSATKGPDLLYYEWTAGGKAFQMYESGNAMLIRIAPSPPDDGEEPKSLEVSQLLFETLNLEMDGPEVVEKTFEHGEAWPVGEVFYAPDWTAPGFNGDWRQLVTGVRSNDAVFVVCYKALEEAAQMDMPYKPRWLAVQLLPDGAERGGVGPEGPPAASQPADAGGEEGGES